MGEEADADWEAGLVEWGIEDAREWYRQQLAKVPRKDKAPRPRRAASTPGNQK